MAGRSTTITSKWVIGGQGTLRDAFPLSPPMKLLLDLFTYLFRHPLYIVFPTIAIITYFNTPNPLFHASLTTFLTAFALSLIKMAYHRNKTKRNIKYLHKVNTTLATVPLDPTSNRRATISLDRSILIGGESGSGKSNMVWKILKGLNEYNIPYRLHVIDPAGGVELNDLQASPYLVNYVDRARNANSLITKMRDDMDQRLSHMKDTRSRKHQPTQEHPLNVLIIDELLLLSTQLMQGVSSPLGELLAVGRKAGFIVIACTQLGQVDTIGRVRDLFPQRICFAVRTSDMADAILGTYATRDGAEAHLLSRPGEGYVFAEDSHNHEKYFERFRSELITNTYEIAHPPIGYPPPTQVATSDIYSEPITFKRRTKRTAVYELYSEDGTPMYVGKTQRAINKRFKEHQADKAWFHQVDMSQTVITHYQTGEEASEAEAQKIKELRPIYNTIHNFGND